MKQGFGILCVANGIVLGANARARGEGGGPNIENKEPLASDKKKLVEKIATKCSGNGVVFE
jgi:hypothetical protein